MTVAIEPKAPLTRIAAIDYGMARLGIAISDAGKIIAMPLATIKAEGKSAETVAKLLKELESHQRSMNYQLLEIVVGLPLLMSGKKGLLADEVHHFVGLLQAATNIPIKLWDERLSSVQAERALREGNLTRKKRSQKIDTVAAAIILQSYLDARLCNLGQCSLVQGQLG